MLVTDLSSGLIFLSEKNKKTCGVVLNLISHQHYTLTQIIKIKETKIARKIAKVLSHWNSNTLLMEALTGTATWKTVSIY